MSIETIEYTLPTWAAGYLINGDADNLSEAELEQLDAFIEREGVMFMSRSDEHWFTGGNDLNRHMGDTVCTYYAVKL
jgi:hypothetical protein